MFKNLIIQIKDGLSVFYQFSSCRVFMMQAYQEYALISATHPNLTEEEKALLDEFVKLNSDTLILLSRLDQSMHDEIEHEWNDLIQKMEEHDNK